MRETIFGFILLLGTAAGFYYARKTASVPPANFTTVTAKGVPKNEGISRKGRNSLQRAKTQSRRKDAGPAGDTQSLKGFPSIYREENEPSAVGSGAFEAEASASAGTSEGQVAARPDIRKDIHGVPLEAWLRSRKNRLSMNYQKGPEEAGLRVYVNCMELRKQVEWMDEKTCERQNQIRRSQEELALSSKPNPWR